MEKVGQIVPLIVLKKKKYAQLASPIGSTKQSSIEVVLMLTANTFIMQQGCTGSGASLIRRSLTQVIKSLVGSTALAIVRLHQR